MVLVYSPITAEVEPINIAPSQGGGQFFILGLFDIYDAALLGTLTLTVKWVSNEVPKEHVETLLLTVLNTHKFFAFRADFDPATEMTYEVSVAGLSGTFGVNLSLVNA